MASIREKLANPQERFELFLSAVDSVSRLFRADPGQIVNLEQIESLPTGTLGRGLSDFLKQNHLKPFTTGHRRKQLHDAVHVLTGYGTDLVGEAEVQAFLLGSGGFNPLNAALKRRASKMILKKSIMPAPELENRLQIAYERGRNSSFNPDEWPIETQWELPLTQVRAEYGV